ncbi:MAG: alpha/beta hydrolase [Limosilactobacillus sp.]|uniref:alpha/beta hydrolase n=1 Tax=Limosilactobacillus sp. TaxID=2773925 RepID=UPI002709E44A|nr:alpha/beta hydrolase [Limosilactobacillus sp.]
MGKIKKFIKIAAIVFTVLVIVGMAVQIYLLRGTPGRELHRNEYRQDTTYTSTPTILVPGWGGNTVTYNKLINYYQDHHYAQKTLTIWVTPWGSIHTDGTLNPKEKNPMIQVLFDWNYDSTFHPQVQQLIRVLTYLQTTYHLKRVNIIAHSYGGTEFMHAFMDSPQLRNNLQLHKVIFLGVPVEESLAARLRYRYHLIKHSHDANFIRLRKQMKQWQPNYHLYIYNLMGTRRHSKRTDGEVPLIESEMLKSLLKGHPTITYHQHIYRNTSHSQLHDRTKILNYIAKQLW